MVQVRYVYNFLGRVLRKYAREFFKYACNLTETCVWRLLKMLARLKCMQATTPWCNYKPILYPMK